LSEGARRNLADLSREFNRLRAESSNIDQALNKNARACCEPSGGAGAGRGGPDGAHGEAADLTGGGPRVGCPKRRRGCMI
jgi:hypothetical protein